MSIARRAAAIVFLGATGSLFASACVKNESSLFIRGCLVAALDTCAVNADPTALERGGGLLDALVGAEYRCPLLVGNQLVPRGDPAKLRTETARIQIHHADVLILNANGSIVGEYSAPATGMIDPGTGTVPGYGIADVLLIDAAAAGGLARLAQNTNLQQEVVASVILRGRTLGGDELETAPWNFPITVCSGCLCYHPADVPDCRNSTEAPEPNCRVGQDNPVDCRYSPLCN